MLVASSLTRDLKIFTSTITAISLMLTVYRLISRYAMRRFWWEDACAVVALIGSVICVVTSWTYFELSGQPSVISFWIYALTYPSVVWLVRLSVLLSIWHIMPPSRNLRRAMLFIGGLFVLMWFSLTITFVGRCMSGHDWCTPPSQRDREGTQSVVIFELINILSDCTLISIPIHSLRSVKLLQPKRRLIIAAFSSNIFVTIVSLFRAACQLHDISALIGVVIEIEVACSMFICNSLFITTLVYRLLRRSNTATDANTDVYSTPRDTIQFTTVDLDALGAFGTNSSASAAWPAMTCPGGGTEKSEDIIPPQYGEV